MATAKKSANPVKDAKALENAVDKAVGQAQDNAETGNVATVKETAKQPAEDLPTGARSHPNQ